MKKAISTFVCIISLFVACQQVRAQLLPSFTNRLQFVLDSVCNANRIKGVSAAVLVPNGGIWKGVHGESAKGEPLRTDMLLGIGSNTKTFFSTLMLKLQEMGKVNINDTIGTWIHNKPNIDGQITIKQCLNHTSGIFSYTEYPSFNDSILANPYRVWQLEDMLNFVNAPYFARGASWQYSNTNYIIAGIIIKTILGKNIETCLRENILSPQGLTNTILYPQETSSLEIAHPWTVNSPSGTLEDMLSWSGYSNNAMLSMAGSAGGIMSTAEDNVKFWNQLMSGQILSTTSMNQLLNVLTVGSSNGHPIAYGLGIFRYGYYWNGHNIFNHGGTLPGYLNENAVDATTGVVISVLSNQDSIGNGPLFDVVVNALHTVSIQTPAVGIAEVSGNDARLQLYPNPASGQITVETEGTGGRLFLELFDISGKKQFAVIITSNKTPCDISGLEAGLYFAVITNEAGQTIKRQKIEVSR
jgi:D-alanyl-D-alanine carboxypeptidase